MPGFPPQSWTFLAAVASAFEPPAGQASYDYVFDLTGEVNQDRGEVVRSVLL